jgi:hypothetical protein
VGTLAGIASLVAMLVGALLGGVLGERWHSKLTRRAVSGRYGPDRTPQPAPEEAEERAAGPDRSRGRGASRID